MNNDLELSELRGKIQEHISKIKSSEDVFGLFRLLNYPSKVLFAASSKRKKETFDFKKEDSQRIKEVYSVLSFDENLPVFLLETNTLIPSFIRSVTTAFDRKYLHFLLIFVSDYSELVFVFPKKEKTETFKSPKLTLTKLIIDKEEIHYTDVQTLSDIYFENEETWRDVWKKWDKSFSVKRVTDAFFEDYKEVFFNLRKELVKQKITSKQSHEFTLQFLNRIMFIYFISKKKWLEHQKFIRWLWTFYKKQREYNPNEFYDMWLKQIFFKAFNNRSNEITGLPEEVTKVLANSPYLNGGLFNPNDLDELEIKITDKMFEKIFGFFEKYNFTIKEDMPLDQVVAVDPQMIGYVYESLANVAEQIYDRNDLGIFYTPRVEVDFMCRRSLVEYLSTQMPDVKKDNLYHLIFDHPEEKEKIEKGFDQKIWQRLEEVLDKLSVIDPACGSGAYLVGMLNVLAELYKTIYRRLNNKSGPSDFGLKFVILQRSLYGVDIMPWAIHAAELRLWLQLIVEAELKKEELRKHPLLPNLNLNLRIGDSLMQEIGGISFNIRTNNLNPRLKQKLDNLKQEKRKYFENSPTAKFKTLDEVKKEETRLFEEIIDERIESLKRDIEILENSFEKRTKQTGLFGTAKIQTELEIKPDKEINDNIESNEEEIEKLTKIKGLLEDPEKKPFVWDIDFAEIFGDKNGFDIVIGNPPYVRQEMISPPNKTKAEVTREDRREYKDKLIKSVQTQFPVVEKIDKKSDYYIYFYFHGLSLLKEKGTFCFITSNSWLDVGYGKSLQEFLCKYAPIIAIYDNPKRSFAHADVNTIIALFGCPVFKEERRFGELKAQEVKNWPMLNNTAKFVMFNKPFEEVLSAKNLIDIEGAKATIKGQGITELVKNVVKTDDYRVFPINQEDLLKEGWEYPEDYKNGRFTAGNYNGNKWGSKYLRAPDIFYTMLEKGKGTLVRLGDIAKVRFGIKTGVNEFFYIDKEIQEKWEIEKEFLKSVIKSPRECKSILINPKDLKYQIFMCHKPKSELKGTNALKYIEWGEKQKTKNGILWCKVQSVSGRGCWYDLGEQQKESYLWSRIHNDSHRIYEGNIYAADTFSVLYPKGSYEITGAVLDSTLAWFEKEIYGRKVLGGGGLSSLGVDLINIELIDPKIIPNTILKPFNKMKSREIQDVFVECGIDPNKPIREQEPKPISDRAEIDEIIFSVLNFNEEQKKEVYLSVCELVKERLQKAKSVSKNGK